MKGYNYAIVENLKQKIVIPIIGLEFEGWAVFLASMLGLLTGTLILGFLASILLGMIAYFFSFTISFITVIVASHFSSDVDETAGKTKLETFYYSRIKKWDKIYSSDGTEHFIRGKEKGVMFVHAYR